MANKILIRVFFAFLKFSHFQPSTTRRYPEYIIIITITIPLRYARNFATWIMKFPASDAKVFCAAM
jgi:hypothetical protein